MSGTAPPILGTAAGNFELSGEMQLEMSRMSNKLKLLLPFVLLLLLKYLLDNFVIGLILMINVLSLYRIQSTFSTQLSLKDRSSKGMLIALLISLSCMLSLDLYIMNAYFDQDSVLDRLAFVYPKPDSSLNFFSSIWYCFVTDGILQMAALAVKLLVCIIVSSKNCSCIRCKVSSCVTMWTSSEASRTQDREVDIEQSVTAESVDFPLGSSSFGDAIGYSTLSALTNLGINTISSGLTGLVRRQVPLSSTAISNELGNNVSSVSSTNVADDATTNSSDYETNDIGPNLESREYLIRLRVCSLIDMLCLLYRTMVPIPVLSLIHI